ncbi:MAG: class E sortase, partial [Mycobacterium sp.]
MSLTTVRMAVGRVVLVSGVLVLLFIPFMLWGTGLMTARSQAALRVQFGIDQQRSGSLTTKHLSAPKQSTVAPAVLQVAPVIADPPAGSPVGTISIPKIALSMVVVEGTDEPQLQAGPGHYPSTPLPGEAGNAAIAGHRTTYLAPFYNLDALVPGDTIVVTTVQGTFLYQMTGNQVVDPSDVAVVAPTSTPELTLTTCNPRYSASQRLVVHAALVASALTHPSVVPVRTADVHRVIEHRSPAATAPPTKNWTAAILWGLAVAVLTIAVWMATRRTHGGRRALVVAAG